MSRHVSECTVREVWKPENDELCPLPTFPRVVVPDLQFVCLVTTACILLKGRLWHRGESGPCEECLGLGVGSSQARRRLQHQIGRADLSFDIPKTQNFLSDAATNIVRSAAEEVQSKEKASQESVQTATTWFEKLKDKALPEIAKHAAEMSKCSKAIVVSFNAVQKASAECSPLLALISFSKCKRIGGDTASTPSPYQLRCRCLPPLPPWSVHQHALARGCEAVREHHQGVGGQR